MTRGDKTVVVVEDDLSMRLAVERFLLASGFHAVTFGSAENLLEQEEVLSVACLVLDIHLPGMSGLELQRRLARSGTTSSVIFITAHDDPATRARAEAQGAIAYLTKPFEGKVLVEAVLRAFARHDARAAGQSS